MNETKDAGRYRENLKGEVDSAALYNALAEAEQNPAIAQVYKRLAAVEDSHAEFWRRKLVKLGAKLPPPATGFRSRLLAWLARRFGPDFVLPVVNTLEHLDSGSYDAQPEAVAGGLPAAERSHARVLNAIAAPLPGRSRTAGVPGSTLASLEGRHHAGGGNALRAAVLGANDGLVSNLSLVMGVAGAAVADQNILITGLAGLLAGACSMALGEWLSVNSSRELFQRQIDTERQELEEMPDEERQELILIYQSKGLSEKEARALADRLLSDKTQALDTLVREELGIDPEQLGGSAWAAAASSFTLFAAGAIFPVAPYFFVGGGQAVAGSLILSAVALVLIGMGTALFTGRGMLFSAARQLAFGYAAAAITYGLGRIIGVSIAG
jgi:vacuolar iron transporter family protein